MAGLLGALGSALQPVGDALGSTVGALTDTVDQTVGTLGNTVDQIGSTANGVLGGIGIDQARGPFQQCIAQALSGDSGRFAFPTDLLFDLTDLHLYNLDHPLTPAAITYPNNVQEVSSIVVCASQYGVAVQGRSGGHSYDNNGLGGMDGSCSIDFRNMKDFRYNEGDRTVTFGPGNLLRDLDRQLALIDRVMAYGVVGEIGTGGHMTIGGLGPLSRLLGTATDQIVSVQCVLANGQIVQANAYENPDLFFAIRGAAWSFALVTEFTMITSPAPSQVVSYQYNITIAPGNAAVLADTFKSWQRFISNPALSRLFASTLTLTNDVLIFSGTYFGDEASFNQLNIEVDVLGVAIGLGITSRVVTTVVHDLVDLVTDLVGAIPAHFYSKSLKVTPQTLWSDAAVDAIFQYIESTPKGTPLYFLVWDLNGGAISDVPPTSTAYWHRDAVYFLQSYVIDLLGPVAPTSYAFLNGLNAFIQQVVPGIDDSAYPGYVDDQLPDYLTAYWGGNVEKLVSVKGRYDPGNVFRNSQSVPNV
ncbi:Glucooligosaccharide oxidase [Zasmidium cellare ATCC 36951]|uniref:Glucooligosaccharide oxidase n=1 Tax=Zasmidium cellare ATCC 36951 TaxID=1080233 RepID=A0A6A6CQE0_ZASCE|nr:Glucooligosaccharide oxidase [Zasmidium cellare ATCC 36951]KAF2168438.1 Glucooligosaccharide oxidase [Zasmidium cellare ATCC 36951]